MVLQIKGIYAIKTQKNDPNYWGRRRCRYIRNKRNYVYSVVVPHLKKNPQIINLATFNEKNPTDINYNPTDLWD